MYGTQFFGKKRWGKEMDKKAGSHH